MPARFQLVINCKDPAPPHASLRSQYEGRCDQDGDGDHREQEQAPSRPPIGLLLNRVTHRLLQASPAR